MKNSDRKRFDDICMSIVSSVVLETGVFPDGLPALSVAVDNMFYECFGMSAEEVLDEVRDVKRII